MAPESHADPLNDLQTRLPDNIHGWVVEGKDRIYDTETIFDYIDGAGEVYRAYQMKACLSRRYHKEGDAPIVVDIFDMASSKGAFGVFTHDRDGDPVDIGQGGLYRSGWLSFWKDHFFISIYMEEEGEEAKKAVFKLAKDLDASIEGKGRLPQILSFLPQEGLVERRIHYLQNHIILNTHYYVSDTNILNLGPETDVVLAGYKIEEKQARLLLIRYDSSKKANLSYERFRRAYLPEAAGSEAVLLENGKWCAVSLKERLVAVVLEADSRSLAERLIKASLRDL
jgi:hypothetical protein